MHIHDTKPNPPDESLPLQVTSRAVSCGVWGNREDSSLKLISHVHVHVHSPSRQDADNHRSRVRQWRDTVVCGCLSVVVYVGERKPYELRIAESTHIRNENQRAYALLCRSLHTCPHLARKRSRARRARTTAVAAPDHQQGLVGAQIQEGCGQHPPGEGKTFSKAV